MGRAASPLLHSRRSVHNALLEAENGSMFHGEPLLATLQAFPDETGWDDLWHAILPHIAE